MYTKMRLLVFLYKLNVMQICNREGQEVLLGIFYKKGSLTEKEKTAVNTVKMLILKAEREK